jgi:hypothetical protein
LRESRLKELKSVTKQLEEKEEELFFFDNYDKMEQVSILRISVLVEKVFGQSLILDLWEKFYPKPSYIQSKNV